MSSTLCAQAEGTADDPRIGATWGLQVARPCSRQVSRPEHQEEDTSQGHSVSRAVRIARSIQESLAFAVQEPLAGEREAARTSSGDRNICDDPRRGAVGEAAEGG